MNLNNFTDEQITSRLERLAKTERKITHEILWHVATMESRKIYLDLGFSSLIKYLMERCHYDERGAYRRMQAAKVLTQVPAISEQLKNGELNLTQLTQVQSCLRQEKLQGHVVTAKRTQEILQTIESKTNFETQKILAVEFNQPTVIAEKTKPQRDDSFRLELTLSSEQMHIIEKAKDYVSHICPNQTWAEVFTCLAQSEIKKREGKRKKSLDEFSDDISAKEISKEDLLVHESIQLSNSFDPSRDRAAEEITPGAGAPSRSPTVKRSRAQSESTRRACSKTPRIYISLKVKRQLFKQANYECQYCDSKSGKKCDSKYKLQVDHIIPLAQGGKDEFQNYRVLCQAHNLSEARRWGIDLT